MRKILLILLTALTVKVSSQIYSFKNFTEDDGLPQAFINDINQDNEGFLFIATGNGITKFGGLTFRNFNKNSGLLNDFVTTVYKDSKGNVWIGQLEGGVSTINSKHKLHNIKYKEEISAKIMQIIELNADHYAFLKNNTGIIVYNEKTGVYDNINDENFYEVLSLAVNGPELLMLKPDGIYSIQIPDLINKKYTVKKIISLKDGATMKFNNLRTNLIVADNSIGILNFEYLNGYRLRDTFKLALNNGSVFTKIITDRYTNIFAATTDNGVYKITLNDRMITNFSKKNGLKSNTIQSIFIDREDNLWIGTYGNGLQQLTSELYSYNYIIDNEGRKLTVNAVVQFNNKIVAATDKGLGYLTDEKINFITHPKITGKKINCLTRHGNKLIFSTKLGELFECDTLFKNISSIPIRSINQEIQINSICDYENDLLICTTEGLIIHNSAAGTQTVLNTSNVLLHNDVKWAFVDSKKRMWICSPNTVIYFVIERQLVTKFNEIPGLKYFNINSVCEDKKNNIWITTSGDGVFKYDGVQFTNYNSSNGLTSNFCYGIVSDLKNGIWVNHLNGISYKNNNKKNFNKIVGNSDLLETSFMEHSVYYDRSNNEILFGTSSGIAKINTSKQHFNEVETDLSIMDIYLNEKPLESFKDTVLSYHAYDLKVTFNGICLTDPTKVKYKYKLEGHVDKWEFVNYDRQTLDFPKLKDGTYTFILYAANNDGLWNSVPVTFKFTIKPPFWKQWWFYVVLISFISLSVYGIIKNRTKNLLLKQKELEDKISEQTVIIRAEKEQVAKINTDLLAVLKDLKDSINYAQKIQSFIIPDLKYVQHHLNTYIYFRPKDIVSGDYYGYFNLPGNRTLLFLIDCTGHGVPGAILTVISKSFLNKIIIDKEIYELDEIIENLNFELRYFFNADSIRRNKNSEGLVMSMCMINYNTKEVEMCGAGRGLLYKTHDNEVVYSRGSHFSVGYDDDIVGLEVVKVPFDKGLRVYMFSDGIQDQFGGDKHKKYSSRRIIDNIKRSNDLSLEEECNQLIDNFNAWREGEKQVDDVCFFAFELYDYT